MSKSVHLSPTVSLVLERFEAALQADDAVKDDAVDRLLELLRGSAAVTGPKIQAALFSQEEGDLQ